MVKAFTKGVATFFVACALLLALPALSFADESTSGGGKSLSDFTDVDWNTVTLSLAQDEYTFDEKGRYEGIDVGDLRNSSGDLRLYVAVEDKKELLSRYTYDYDYCFYSDTEGHEVEDGVTETGTYYVKVTLKDYSSGYECYDRYVPVTITIKNVDPYDLANYSKSESSDGTDIDLYVGDEALNSTAEVFRTQYIYYSYWSLKKGECFLHSDAYTVDPTWYKAIYDEESDETSYEPIDGAPTEYGYYAVRLIGAGDYTGEIYTEVRVRDLKYSSNFYISNKDNVSLANYETVSDLQEKLEVSAYGKNDDDSDAKVLSEGTDYKILKWGIENEDYRGDADDEEACTEVSLSDRLKGGNYAVRIEPCGDYYGKSVWLYIYVNDLSLLDSYDFSFDCGNRSNFVIGLDDLSTSKLKVVASCELGEEAKALTQGVDFELGDIWYKSVNDSNGDSSYVSMEGAPSESGWYAIQAIGKGTFEGQAVYVETEIEDSSKLSQYYFNHKQYLTFGDDLLPENLDLELKGCFGYLEDDGSDSLDEYFFYRTLTLGTDYTVRWGSYSNGSFQLLDEGEYPEITDEASEVSYDWYLQVIGLGDFEGQELDPASVAIHKAECTHSNAYSIDFDPDCTDIGVSGSLYCPDCGYEVEGERIDALGHDYQEVSGTGKAATCTEDGYEADKQCTRCGNLVYGDTISKLGGEHSYVTDPDDTTPAKAATCTEDGYEPAKVCSNCGDRVEGKVVPKGSGTHNYVVDESDTTPAKDATCTEDGYEPTQVCSICGDKIAGKTIAALGHRYKEVADSAKEATCAEGGKRADKQCTRCDDKVEGEATPALGHSYQEVEGTAKAATCTEAGKKADEKCSNCGDEVTGETIPALGHDYQKVADSVKDATCTEDGKEADEKCTRCDDVKEGAVIKANGEHSYEVDSSDTTSAKVATCTEDGYEPAQVCTVCGNKVEGKTIPALGHEEVADAAKAATCTEPGLTEGSHCSRCSAVIKEQSEVPALGHDYQEVAGTAKAATCTENGKEADRKCSRCGDTKEGDVIKAAGKQHAPVVSKAAVAATYKAAGLTEEIKCSVCGTVLQAQSTVAKLSAKAQSVKVSTATKTVKKAKVKKKAQTVSGAIKVLGAQGKVSFAKASGSGKLKVNASNGKITVKKKTKKGTYSIKVRVNVAASADGQFNAFSKTVTVKVKVK